MRTPTIRSLLHAAGSLRGALTDIAKAFEAAGGPKVQATYEASGTLRDEIAVGAKAEVFASANMAHPQSLAQAGKSSPVVLFARNRLCALVRPGLAVTPANLLDAMLRSDVKLGTSTPKADPSGDYAWEVFRKADALRQGAFDTLEKKPPTPPVSAYFRPLGAAAKTRQVSGFGWTSGARGGLGVMGLSARFAVTASPCSFYPEDKEIC